MEVQVQVGKVCTLLNKLWNELHKQNAYSDNSNLMPGANAHNEQHALAACVHADPAMYRSTHTSHYKANEFTNAENI